MLADQGNARSLSDESDSSMGIRVVMASRTDRGVHAKGQVALVRSRYPLARDDPMLFGQRLNNYLPEDLCIVDCNSLPEDSTFDPRKDSVGKWYRYSLVCGGLGKASIARDAFWLVPSRSKPGLSKTKDIEGTIKHPHEQLPLNLTAMREAAAHLVGQPLNFTSFANAGGGSSDGEVQRDPVCSLDACVISLVTPTVAPVVENFTSSSASSAVPIRMEVNIDIRGSRFLYNMVRVIVGTLVEVGLGKVPPGSIPEILARRDRQAAGPGAPAKGLCLMEVYY